jgi:outer membrane protein assembly factor BamB
LRLLWRQPCGGGYASFAVADRVAFTIEQRREQEVVVAYEMDSGRELWTHGWTGYFTESMGGDGPRATPEYSDGRIYALGGEGELRCLDAATGQAVWSKNILADNRTTNITYGMAASPLVVDDKVIVLPGGGAGRSVVAYDKRTGAPLWRTLDDKAAYAAPMAVMLAGRRQLLVLTAMRAVGLDIGNGDLLWETPWRTEYDINSAMPIIIDANRFILTSGYGTGAALVEITSADAGFAAREVWRSQAMKCKFNNAVHHNGVIYGLDEGILAAMDVETGKRLWKGGRYGYGQLLLASGHLVIATEQGDVVLVEATPERHNEVARFSALDGKTWNVPAMAGGRLLVRNTAEMACYRVSP